MHAIIHLLDQDWQHDLDLHQQIMDRFQQAESASKQLTSVIEKMTEEKLRLEVTTADDDEGNIESVK